MFGGLPTPTETEAPDNVLTTATNEYHQHPDCDGSPIHHEDHNGHLTTSQSAHITLRLVHFFIFFSLFFSFFSI